MKYSNFCNSRADYSGNRGLSAKRFKLIFLQKMVFLKNLMYFMVIHNLNKFYQWILKINTLNQYLSKGCISICYYIFMQNGYNSSYNCFAQKTCNYVREVSQQFCLSFIMTIKVYCYITWE